MLRAFPGTPESPPQGVLMIRTELSRRIPATVASGQGA
jgi:hypothetical protein